MPEITSYTALTTPGNYDVIPIVDVSDPAQSAAGTTKKITYLDLTQGLSGGGGGGGGGSQLPWINVTDAPYNADGSGENDATTAIQDAINAAGAGGVVYFPPGKYTISSVLTVTQNITLMGDNGGGQYFGQPCCISQTSTSANGITCTNSWNVYIRNLAITGPGYVGGTLGTGTGTGLYMTYESPGPAGFCALEGVYIGGFGDNGLYVSGLLMSTFTRVWSAWNGNYGIWVNGGTTETWDSCWAAWNGAGGWNIPNGANYTTWNGCGADDNTGNGWTVYGTQACAWNGCGAENNSGNCMDWTGYVWACVINGFWCSNAAIGLNVGPSCYNCTITGLVETTLANAVYGVYVTAGSEIVLIFPQCDDPVELPSLGETFCAQLINSGTTGSTLSLRTLQLGTPLGIQYGGTGTSTAATAIAALVGSGIPECAFTGAYSPAVSNLTFGTTIAVNAALGNDFRVTLTNSTATMGAPANPVNGQAIRFQLTQPSGGGSTLAWAAGTGGYEFGVNFGTYGTAPTLTATASRTDIVKFVYNSTRALWLFDGITYGM
jgi:Pectate lyase superfamily protein